ncbi:probable ADP-ribosylation factor GTPase-activating protein AGD14 isoform X1 [Solanum stenotomum]|uniref:probable ADP-ribosylation factor GTPase-activating protein AGD14 isoform X1 n=1 Tax=Solanum stenotomum TaxID=172797 RepID=UPI0020D03E31|nr:probable ADP-ribosylation factor GTPase-activating protein AGD14 isoform X1 [Solanum stenotomum]
MSSRREEERNEKIIRGLLKLPPNRKCINCNSLGPQYVCTNFWTFVCMTCSGIHREFTHRVKSVSMSKFTSQEVEALQQGGNQRAREIYLKSWDPQSQWLPNNSNVDKVREFIKTVYVDKKYAGVQSSDRPPRDTQNLRNHDDDMRRASSYHSYSQSPPYDFQYEERRYGKNAPALSRKPGSDRGLYEGKVSSFLSPSRLSDHMYDDRFGNEGSNPRASDYSVSSGGDPFRSVAQSPNFQRGIGSPLSDTSRDISYEDVRHAKKDAGRILRAQRTASSGSFESFDSNSLSFKSVNSVGLADVTSESKQSIETHSSKLSTFPSLPRSVGPGNPDGPDLFNAPSVAQNAPPTIPTKSHLPVSSPNGSIDLFQPSISTGPIGNSHQPSLTLPPSSLDFFSEVPNLPSAASADEKPSCEVTSKNEGWATFDMQRHAATTGIEQFTLAPTPAYGHTSFDFLPEKTQQQSVTEKSLDVDPERNDGWATFDVPQHVTLPGSNNFTSNKIQLKGDSQPNSDPTFSVMQWPSPIESAPHGPAVRDSTGCALNLSMPAPLHGGVQNVEATPSERSTDLWSAFDVSNDHLALKSLPNSKEQVVMNHDLVDDQYMGLRGVENVATGQSQRAVLDSGYPITSFPSYVSASSSGLSTLPVATGVHSHANEQKSNNPFDLPYDADMECSNMPQYWDMSSLQAALPSDGMSSSFVGGVTESWFLQNPATTYVPAGQHGTLFVSSQPAGNQISNVPTHGQVAPISGNPFA